MDLLEFGMKNKESGSAVKKTLARGALAAAKKKADLYEAYLEKHEIDIPQDTEEEERLLKQIQKKIQDL